MDKVLRIAVGSTCSKPGDLPGNLGQIEQFAQEAERSNSDMLLTPELSATGYGGFPEVLGLAEKAGSGPVYRELSRLAHEYRLMILAGFVELWGEKRYLAHYAVYPDGRFIVQRKHRVTPREFPLDPSVELFYDETEDIGHVYPGQEQFVFFSLNGVRCGIVICADLGVRSLHQLFDDNQVELMLLPTAAGGIREDRVINADLHNQEGIDRYYRMAIQGCSPGDGIVQCIRHRRALAAVNMCGYDGKRFYHGGQGSIVNPFGDVVALLPGIPNLDRQKPRLVWGEINFNERLGAS